MDHTAAATRFVDRAVELERLEAALDRAASRRPSLVVIGGDAGVGKTRLLHELTRGADATVLRGSCLPLGARGLPFAPVADVVQGLLDDGLLDEVPEPLSRLLPGPAPARGRPPPGQANLFLAFLRVLEDAADRGTTALIVEDIHWADRSTRALLTFVTHNLREQRLLVLATYRSDDLDRAHPLRLLLAELHRHPRVDRIELAPFGPSDVATYLEAITGAPPSRRLVEEVVERTDGNAFFIEELAASDGLEGTVLPASLRDLLLARTQALSPDAQRLLRIASAAGPRVDHELLAAVAGTPHDRIAELIREAVSRQLLVPDGDGYRLRHALLREALHADLLPGERVAVHRDFARALSEGPGPATGRRPSASAELADHWHEAGDDPRALTAWVEAAAAAEGMTAFAEARHHLEHALSVWDRVEDAGDRTGTTRLELLRRAAEDAFLGGDPEVAAGLAREAIARVDPMTDRVTSGVLHDRLARYLWDTADQGESLEIQRRAVELVPADPPSADRADVLAGLAGHLMVLGRLTEARDICEAAIDVAGRVGATHAGYVALNTLGTIVCTTDDVDVGLGMIREALRTAQANDDALEQMRGHWNLFANTFSAARWEEALVLFEDAAEALPKLGQAHLVPELQIPAADCLFRLGRWDDAERMVDDAQRRQRAGDEPVRLPELEIARGRLDAARTYLEGRGSERPVVNKELEGWPKANLADIAVWEGRLDDARRLIAEGLEVTADQDESLATAYLCAIGLRAEADRARIARARRRRAERDTAVTTGERLLEHLRRVLARPGPTDGWRREVGALAGQCEGEGTRLVGAPDPSVWDRAVLGWEALSMPYAAAYCRWRQGEASLDLGSDRDRARTVLVQAYATADQLGALPLAQEIVHLARRARIDVGAIAEAPLEQAPALTPREQEVLRLVAAGQSNRQIAEALFISDKTASVHVSNILRKLDVDSRGQAAAVAHRDGLVD